MTARPMVFLDFDGTITRNDVVDSILQAYAAPTWLAFEEDWKAGRIGSRECLRAQMALVEAQVHELDALLDTISVDEGFAGLLEVCAKHGVPTHIISDGFDYCIARILGRPGLCLQNKLRRVQVFASHLEPNGKTWRAEFPYFEQLCTHGCATCKPAVMRWLNPERAAMIFVGDGLSDRHAAASADLVFGQNLGPYCRELGIAYVGYTNLGEVARHLDLLLSFDLATRGAQAWSSYALYLKREL